MIMHVCCELEALVPCCSSLALNPVMGSCPSATKKFDNAYHLPEV